VRRALRLAVVNLVIFFVTAELLALGIFYYEHGWLFYVDPYRPTIAPIEEGSADVLCGTERVAGLLAGDVFGEIALLSSGRRTASVVAVTPMRLITLFKRDLWQIEEQYPVLAEELRATVKERLGRSAALADQG